MARAKADKLNESINVPVPRSLKRKIIEMADAFPSKPPHTRFTRMLIEAAVEKVERKELELIAK